MRVIVIGGGPAGMLASIAASRNGDEVTLIEKNSILGKKILITGKGRCNLTNNIEIDEFIKNIPGNGKFLYSAFKNYSNRDIITMVEKNGVKTKVERGNRVFPVSDRAEDVRKALEKEVKNAKVKVRYNSHVKSIIVDENDDNKRVKGVMLSDGEKLLCDKVIIATGGKSYSGTGSTGDGYKMAERVGHTIERIRGSLVPLEADKHICAKLQGLSLKNVRIEIRDIENSKTVYEDFGEMLFTHFGLSGPMILSGSAHLLRYKDVDRLLKEKKIKLYLDLKPALPEQELDKRIVRDFEEYKNKEYKNSLDKLLPKKMIDVIVELSKIQPTKKVNEITKEERRKLVSILKRLEIGISGFRSVEEAIVTAGGVSIKEINPKTMESKIVQGLYFAGEVIDVDAYTGGFNLQIAYSTGYTAGISK